LLALFGVIEISIGVFGAFSLQVFEWVGVWTLRLPLAVTTAATVTVTVLPTLFMGATLPILTQYVVGHERNVGRSVGLLYFVNTSGSAVACFVCALWLMRATGMQNAVNVAAVINVSVGVSALYLAHSRGWKDNTPPPMERELETATRNSVSGHRQSYFVFAVIVAMLTGYVGLSYEVLWFRAFMIGTNRAPAFALILGTYLGGLAVGSFWVRLYCSIVLSKSQLLYLLCILILLSGGLGFSVLPISAQTATWGLGTFVSSMLLLVFAQTAIAGAAFPLLCHLGIRPDESAGVRVSGIYASNIFGSVGGTIFTGFILMDRISTAQISVLLTVVSALAAIAVAGMAQISRSLRIECIAGALSLAVTSLVAADAFFDHYYEKIIFRQEFDTGTQFAHVVENKSGVITVSVDGTVYGGGIYDGRVSVDLIDDKNFIIRPFSLALFHPSPREVLMIGLSTGAWAQVIANNPEIKRLTIVEINPGYLPLIRKYGAVAPILSNPKVEIVIDDGRRWMNRHPDRKFDVILQNSSWYFRPNITNLLSTEYLQLSSSHLKEGGVMMYNTNYSTRVMLTGCTMFPYGFRELNMLVVSHRPLLLNSERLRSMLERYEIDGRPVFDLSDPRHRRRLDEIVFELSHRMAGQGEVLETMETCENVRARSQALHLVTDDNMGEEWH